MDDCEMAPEHVVDLRSDTVTRPTPAMKQAMFDAEVGDDVWGDDPTVNKLQAMAVELFGMDAALFCPSGTMTNQIAIKLHTSPGDELLCADSAHIYNYEAGGIAFNSGVQAKCLPSDRGRISVSQILAAINADDVHFPATRLVCLENTSNKGGGAYYSMQQLADISQLCRERGLKLHLDGARIFNAIVASGQYTPKDLGRLFDSISVCLSKGLGCPVGSLLLGSHEFIARARRIRKVLGGGMRQAGFLAAAGIYALQNNIPRLAEDHTKAQRLAEVIRNLPYVSKVEPVDTNIVIFQLQDPYSHQSVTEHLADEGVLVSHMGGGLLRCVTHLDVSHEDIEMVCQVLQTSANPLRRKSQSLSPRP